MKGSNTSENASTDIVNLGVSVKNEKTIVYISSLIIRNDKLDKNWKQVDELIEKQWLVNHLLFLYNENIKLGMLNKRGLQINESGTKQLLKKFCFDMSKWCDTTCMDKPTTTTEHIVNRKTVNKNLRTYSYLLQDFKWYQRWKRSSSQEKRKW